MQAKAELVARLKQLNDEAASGLHTDEQGGRTEDFQLRFSTVVLQLKVRPPPTPARWGHG